jgi:hypothetical protein
LYGEGFKGMFGWNIALDGTLKLFLAKSLACDSFYLVVGKRGREQTGQHLVICKTKLVLAAVFIH